MESKVLKTLESGLYSWEHRLKKDLEEWMLESNKFEMVEKQREELQLHLQQVQSALEKEKEENTKLKLDIECNLKLINQLQQQREMFAEKVGKELTAQMKLIKANYEIENLRAIQKQYERELGIQKSEYEKLKMINQKLQRDNINNAFKY